MLKKVIPVEDAISVLHDGDVLSTAGYGGHGVPEQLLVLTSRVFETRGEADRNIAREHEGQDR